MQRLPQDLQENFARPSKRARTNDAGRSGEPSNSHSPPHAPRQRMRAAIACVRCRDRKTRCDGGRPVCGYCARTSSACQYEIADGSGERTMSHEMGVQILQAIGELTQFVKGNSQKALPRDGNSNEHTPSSALDLEQPYQTATSTGYPQQLQFSEGLDSIFKWRVFPSGLEPIPVDDGKSSIPMPDELPPVTLAELTRLQMNYRRVVHNVNPILDLGTLDHYVTHIAENGFDWTTRACLVALVCAIGAICHEKPIETPGSLFTVDGNQDDVEVAYRFWSVACKRLGRAMSQRTLESAQCLCLAGRSRRPSEPQSPQSISRVIEDSIFYTAYKSELELRYELAIPGSVLEHIQDQLVFPSPPTPSQSTQLESLNEETVSWYYYLSDIAARHLINRILKFIATTSAGEPPSELQAKALLQNHKMFKSQLEGWHQSLPPQISFPPPASALEPEPDIFKRILRARYLVILELLCRPFVRICLNYHLSLPDELIDEMASVASHGLQCCAWRLQAHRLLYDFDWGCTELDVSRLECCYAHMAPGGLARGHFGVFEWNGDVL
ncbi:hypothetical protein BJX62DRAFT_242540 [Aspergillus germanicus]